MQRTGMNGLPYVLKAQENICLLSVDRAPWSNTTWGKMLFEVKGKLTQQGTKRYKLAMNKFIQETHC